MISFYTYLHCKPDGTPFYVGKGHGKRSHRLRYGRNVHHQRIVAKHGEKNILVYVFPCDSEQEAFDDEIHQIAQLRRDGYELANFSTGGEGPTGTIRSAETRAKLSAVSRCKEPEVRAKMRAAKLGKKASDETRAKMSAAQKGRKMPEEFGRQLSIRNLGNKYGVGNKINLGRKQSVETIANRVKKLIGQKRSPEARQKMSLAQKGRTFSIESRAKMSASHVGQVAWNKGKRLSDEHKSKLSAARKKSLVSVSVQN